MCKMMSRFATIVVFCLFISSSPLINASVEGEEAAADLRYVYDTTPYQGAFALNSDLMALQNQINGNFIDLFIFITYDVAWLQIAIRRQITCDLNF